MFTTRDVKSRRTYARKRSDWKHRFRYTVATTMLALGHGASAETLSFDVFEGRGSSLDLVSQSNGPQSARGTARGLGWLTGDFNGDGRTDLVHLQDNEGRLGLGFYLWSDQVYRIEAAWQTDDAGGWSDALAWQVADIDGDGKDEILQSSSNDNRIGLVAYSWNNQEGRFRLMAGSSDLGQDRDTLAWLAGDLDGDGSDELVQIWRNRGRLAVVRYGWSDVHRQFRATWETHDVGQGADALQYLMADIDGDGRADIAQAWLNGDRVGFVFYEWRSEAEGLQTKYAISKAAHAHEQMIWATGDADGDGKAEIIYGSLAEGKAGVRALIWRPKAKRLDTAFVMSEISPLAGSWKPLLGDIDGDGAAELIALANERPAMHVVRWDAAARAVSGWYTGAIAGSGATMDWLAGDVDGDGRSEIVRITVTQD